MRDEAGFRQQSGPSIPANTTFPTALWSARLIWSLTDYLFHSVLIRATGNWLLHPRTISTYLRTESIWITGHLGGEIEGHCQVSSVAKRWRWRSPDWYLIGTIVISLEALCPSSPLSDYHSIHNKSFVNLEPVNHHLRSPADNKPEKSTSETLNYRESWQPELWL